MEAKVSNREKYQSGDVIVSRNHENPESWDDGIYLRVSARLGGRSFSPGVARDIAAALIEAAEEFDAMVAEANDPLNKRIAELDAAGHNALVAGKSGYVSYLKKKERWYSLSHFHEGVISCEVDVKKVAESSLLPSFTFAYAGNTDK